ncbi:MAG: bifunctional 4-hydroxy-2-oxoglutarate aldolase/2-dehydro-3-deoxy-phosphogluconate aldolase [Clostridia bacterium]|nr:bifunctional 4-hydroxy-2-oxoglutarate aldolase/2-dehydro-3-deoxy-phosphogluconate aldolase [Clostridia bacterium]
MNKVFLKIKQTGIIPVIKLENPNDIIPLSEALLKGGINVAEITFRTSAAEDAIKKLKSINNEMIIGAGTVLTTDNAERAIAAGAEFIVSPGFNPKIVDYCINRNFPIAPGISIPSEIEQALERGLDVVKFFPAEQSGGLPKIKAMSAAYGDIMFIPTGGISADNLSSYISFNKVLACGGTFMVKDSLIKEKQWNTISELSRKAVEIVNISRKP